MDEDPFFHRGEKVRAYNRGILYDALIMEVVRTAGRASRYKVHYVGWNKGHDEVLEKAKIIKNDADQSPQKGESDIIDLSENNCPATVIKKSLKKRKVDLLDEDGSLLPKSHKASRKPETELKAAQKKPNTTDGAIVNVTENKDNYQLPAQVEPFNRSFWEYKFEINMPEPVLNFLRAQEEILSESSNERLLPPLPWQSKKATAAKVLDLFLLKFADEGLFRKQESAELQNIPSHEVLKGIMSMVSEHFNKMLPAMLLYPLEWRQYESLCRSGSDVACCSTDSTKYGGTENSYAKPVDVYGAEHLLRMLYILPQLLVMPMEDKESVAEQNYYKLVKESLDEFKTVFEELVRFIADEKHIILPSPSTISIDNTISELDAEKDVLQQENGEAINNNDHKTPIPNPVNKLTYSDTVSLDRDNSMTGHSSNSDLTESTVEKENSIKTIIINDSKNDKVSPSDNIININNPIFENLTPLQTKKRKERKEKNNNGEKDDDNNSDINLMNSPLLDISDSETDNNDNDKDEDEDENSYNNHNDSDKRRKLIKEEEIAKISLSSFSWTCLKCHNLNSQKARSCDVCGIKKPSVQVPPKKKIKEKIFILGVRQKQKPGRKPKIKGIENEELNMNNTQNSNLIKDVDKLSIIEGGRDKGLDKEKKKEKAVI